MTAGKKRHVWVLFHSASADDAERSVGTVHGVYSSAEKAEAAADEWMARDCAVTFDQLSIDSWAVDDGAP